MVCLHLWIHKKNDKSQSNGKQTSIYQTVTWVMDIDGEVQIKQSAVPLRPPLPPTNPHCLHWRSARGSPGPASCIWYMARSIYDLDNVLVLLYIPPPSNRILSSIMSWLSCSLPARSQPSNYEWFNVFYSCAQRYICSFTSFAFGQMYLLLVTLDKGTC